MAKRRRTEGYACHIALPDSSVQRVQRLAERARAAGVFNVRFAEFEAVAHSS
jgi:hypothetical protein